MFQILSQIGCALIVLTSAMKGFTEIAFALHNEYSTLKYLQLEQWHSQCHVHTHIGATAAASSSSSSNGNNNFLYIFAQMGRLLIGTDKTREKRPTAEFTLKDARDCLKL